MKDRRKILEFIMSITMLVLVYICASGVPVKNVGSENVSEEKEKTVVLIDPGHGGVDPGKISVTGTNEKEINLQIALLLRDILEKDGFEVVMTRETDEGLYEESDQNKKVADMKARCLLAEQSHADILVSVHQNSYQEEEVHGAQVFYYSKSKTGEQLATSVQNAFKEIADPDNTRMAKGNDSYYILLNVECPAIIAECGFLSNYEEAELLEEENYQKKVAEAIAKGIMDFQEAENNT